MDRNWVDNYLSRPFTVPVSRPTDTGHAKSATSDTTFSDILKERVQHSDVRFSAHAADRLKQRGVALSAMDLQKLSHAVDQANQKGAKDAYLVYRDAGFVVNVPNRTVVTTMWNHPGTVVTQVDSVVFV